MKNDFEQRKNNRIAYAKQQAQKNAQLSNDFYVRSSEMAKAIPFGQPILVGHHSEKRDRNYRNRIHNLMGQSVQADKKKTYYEQKAEAIESNTAIFSDDPKALEKLQSKLVQLQDLQDFMKAANKCIRKKDKEGFLKLPNATPALWEQLSTPNQWKQIGFPHYRLANNNQVINATKKRIEQLERIAALKTTELKGKGFTLVQNAEAGRVQFVFDGKPSEEIRTKLKKNGFKWSPLEQAWQRHLNGNGIYAAKQLFNELNATTN